MTRPMTRLTGPPGEEILLSSCLGFYCMIGGGITPLLAAGFTDVAAEYKIDTEQVALTAGFSMLGMGLGSIIASPTAILYGKRPVYLASGYPFHRCICLVCRFTQLYVACRCSNLPGHVCEPRRMSAFRHYCRDFLPAREGFPDWYLHPFFCWAERT